jgi:hypothetical protein
VRPENLRDLMNRISGSGRHSLGISNSILGEDFQESSSSKLNDYSFEIYKKLKSKEYATSFHSSNSAIQVLDFLNGKNGMNNSGFSSGKRAENFHLSASEIMRKKRASAEHRSNSFISSNK